MKLKFVLLMLSACFTGTTIAQTQAQVTANVTTTADTTPPYLKHPEMPAFKIQLMDSVSSFNTYNIKPGKKTVLMLFGPDCEHCQHMADSIRAHMSELKNANLYMFSFAELRDIKKFAEKYKLNKEKNIVFGKDIDFFFAGFYKLSAVPGIAIYDEKKQFVKLFNGGAKITDITSAVNNK